MKKVAIILFFLLSITSFAQMQQGFAGNLTVFSEGGIKFKLYLNGRLQNNNWKTSVRVENLTQTVYSVKIQFERTSLPSMPAQNITIGKRNAYGGVDFYDITYKIIKGRNNKANLVYFAQTSIFQPVTIIIDPIENGHYYGDGRPPISQPRGCAGRREMRQVDFRNAKIAIDNERFSSDKIKLANRIIADNCMSTSQIYELIEGYFSFDSARLEVALFAYEYCVDPKNYYQINSLLSFSSSKDKLNQYIQLKK